MKIETYRRSQKLFYRWYFRFYHRLKVIGLENIPDGAALIAAHHEGGYDLDNHAISSCHPTRDIHVLDWDKYHYINSLWGRYFLVGGIPLWLHGGIRWNYINPYLHKKGSQYPSLVCIFPEGNSGSLLHRHILWKFFPGVVRIALKYKVPIVPAAMIGFQKASPILISIEQEHAPADPIYFPLITLPFKLKIEFGTPFELDKFYDKDLTREEEVWIANRIIRPKIAKLCMKHRKFLLQKVDFKMKKPTYTK